MVADLRFCASVILVTGAFILSGCSQPPATVGRTDSPVPALVPPTVPLNPGVDPVAAGVPGLMFSPSKVLDGQTVAYQYLKPKGWVSGDHLQWATGKTPYPMVQMETHSPDGNYVIAVFPLIGGAAWRNQIGGGGVAFANAGEAVDKLVQSAPGTSDYRVIQQQAQRVQPPMPSTNLSQNFSDMVIKRVTFHRNGKARESIIIARLDTALMRVEASESRLWHLSAQILTAPEGQLVTDRRFLRQAATMFATAQITPQYNQIVNKISYANTQRNIRIAQQQNEEIWRSYYDRQKIQDQNAKNFDDYIRDVSTYGGGNGQPSYTLPNLPSGGKYWIDPNGNIMSTEDPNANPNQGSGPGWTQLNHNAG